MFTTNPCINCGTTLSIAFNFRKSRNICRKCLQTIKYSPLGREYVHGKINQLIVNKYWKSSNKTKVNNGKPYSELEITNE